MKKPLKIVGVLFFIAAGIGIWLVPFRITGDVFWDSAWLKWSVRLIASYACLSAILEIAFPQLWRKNKGKEPKP